jgi:hypothetical protein
VAVTRICQAISVTHVPTIRRTIVRMASVPICIAIGVVHVTRYRCTVAIMEGGRAFAYILTMQLTQVCEAIAIVQAALLHMPIMRIVRFSVQGLAMLRVMHCALVTGTFSGARALNLSGVGNRHFRRLVATKYLCFFFRHNSPQHISESATCSQQRCLQ